ncbi:MAG: penicillin-binding protein activator [Alphaproteobacteria bacterium]|nr:penicillin-binding protein activator [Alphaproteobacteria bacterium]
MLSQEPPAGQTATYHPPYEQPAPYEQGYWQNVSPNIRNPAAAPSVQAQTLPSITPVPQPAAPVVIPAPAAAASGTVKVAILLPLSGRNAALGQAMLNAAQQAVFDSAAPNFALQPHDTAAAGGAAAAAQQAVDGGAQLIIGPLFASNIPAVEKIAAGANIDMLPLSSDTALAQRGVYVMGLAPAAQVDRVVAYAAARGIRRFAALVPSTPYGALVDGAFRQAVLRHGGTVVDDETFTTAQDIGSAVKNLAQLRDQIDGLFLPESGANLKIATDQLTASGFAAAQMHIMGTGLWDVPGLGQQNPMLVGAWYAAPDPAARHNFVAAYAAAYGQEPPRLATLAYDATALAAVLAKRGGRYDDAALMNPNGFAGLDGIFRLHPDGSVERELAVDQVTADGAQVIDRAPVSFVNQAH